MLSTSIERNFTCIRTHGITFPDDDGFAEGLNQARVILVEERRDQPTTMVVADLLNTYFDPSKDWLLVDGVPVDLRWYTNLSEKVASAIQSLSPRCSNWDTFMSGLRVDHGNERFRNAYRSPERLITMGCQLFKVWHTPPVATPETESATFMLEGKRDQAHALLNVFRSYLGESRIAHDLGPTASLGAEAAWYVNAAILTWARFQDDTEHLAARPRLAPLLACLTDQLRPPSEGGSERVWVIAGKSDLVLRTASVGYRDAIEHLYLELERKAGSYIALKVNEHGSATFKWTEKMDPTTIPVTLSVEERLRRALHEVECQWNRCELLGMDRKTFTAKQLERVLPQSPLVDKLATLRFTTSTIVNAELVRSCEKEWKTVLYSSSRARPAVVLDSSST